MASSWPLSGLSLILPKSTKFRDPHRRHFRFIKYCVSSSFSPNSGFLAFGSLLASSWPLPGGFFWPLPGLFPASSGFFGSFWLLPGLFWPLPGLFWPLPGLVRPLFLDSPKISKIQGPTETSFSVHKALRFEQFSPNSGFLAFRASSGLFLTSSWPLRLSGLFRASSGPFEPLLAFLASSGLFLAPSWPLPDLVLASSGLFPASSRLFLAFS